MQWFFLTGFVLSSVVHLWHSFHDDKKRAYSKPLLMMFLLLFYLTAAEKINVTLLLALVFCWLGDVLLIPRGNKWFVCGGISFLLGHVMLIVVYFNNISFKNVSWPIVIPTLIVYFAISAAIVYKIIENTPKKMLAPMLLYLMCNSLMNVFALIQLLQLGNTGALLAFIGAAMFFASDCVLYLVRYYHKPDIIYRKHFTIMLLYLSGTLLITWGLMLITA